MSSDFTEKKVSSRAVYRGRMLNVNEDEVRLPDGSLALREYVLHPGAVRTGMTDYTGMMEAPESARGLLQRIDELTLETTGRFVHMSGEPLPW